MHKFVLKFSMLFVLIMAVPFFALIFFQKQTMEQEFNRAESGYSQPFSMHQNHPPMGYMPSMGQAQDEQPPKNPPIYIPCLLILFASYLYIFFLLRYLSKNFIVPLDSIGVELKKLKDGNENVNFSADSENKNLQQTIKILNEVVISLKEKDELEQNFLQNLAHDLRTPIMAQERAINILQKEYSDNELLEGLKLNSQNWSNMVNLIIETYNNKQILIKKINLDLHNLINQIFNTLEAAAKEKNIQLINNSNKGFVCYADYISINRIIMNLTMNAIDNIQNNKKVTVTAKNENKKTIIIVEDNGKGIDDENLKNIFNKYVTGKKSKKAISGLGLYIVKELVEKNGGTIEVFSEVDKYTKFIIELPET